MTNDSEPAQAAETDGIKWAWARGHFSAARSTYSDQTALMTSIPAFVLARLAEAEAAARAVADRPGVDRAVADLPAPVFDFAVANGPRRVLADVAAKRAIVETCGTQIRLAGDAAGWTDWEGMATDTLRHLASVYRDHADYDEGWAL